MKVLLPLNGSITMVPVGWIEVLIAAVPLPKNISFVELGKNKDNKIKAMVYSYKWFLDEMEQNHEVRGW